MLCCKFWEKSSQVHLIIIKEWPDLKWPLNPFPLARMKNLLKHTLALDGKTVFINDLVSVMIFSLAKILWIKEYYFTQTEEDFTPLASTNGNNYWNWEESNL